MGTMLRVPAAASQAESWRQWFGIGIRLLGRDTVVLLELVATWQDRVRQRHHLASLTSRELADIGLCRTDIQVELDKPFWRP